MPTRPSQPGTLTPYTLTSLNPRYIDTVVVVLVVVLALAVVVVLG